MIINSLDIIDSHKGEVKILNNPLIGVLCTTFQKLSTNYEPIFCNQHFLLKIYSLKKFYIYFYLYVYAYVCTHDTCLQCPPRPKERVKCREPGAPVRHEPIKELTSRRVEEQETSANRIIPPAAHWFHCISIKHTSTT